MAKLGVNVDHVATLREARKTDYPDPVFAAKLALDEGVSCITVHLREDRRHIQESDVRAIRRLPSCRLNMEIAPAEEVISIALDIRPEQVTIVPERREELTTEGGLDVAGRGEFYRQLTKRFHAAGISTSLFIDPYPEQIDASAATNAHAIEINTAKYSEARSEKNSVKSLREIENAIAAARSHGLVVHAGHGLNYKNVSAIASLEGIHELNIGHSIVSQAMYTGFSEAVGTMIRLIEKASTSPREGRRSA